jgi:hypothetical protein
MYFFSSLPILFLIFLIPKTEFCPEIRIKYFPILSCSLPKEKNKEEVKERKNNRDLCSCNPEDLR